MAKKKSSSAEAVKARARRAAPKKAAPKKGAGTASTRKKKGSQLQPPKKLFDAMKWCGVLPELAGDSLKIQRKLRDEWAN
ncbi:MAG: hypothetical protein IPH05_10350 [Flavobacteriales bacterium]|jgi:hypothetical protein|nr:hypothetical protein [Flavobacteriales bacterium]MBK6883325.1 hypothetical protein [Flavobacteriales bacterium]MBK7113931.1 hypothetical protein [Flavobacteriales bacterium]MBK7620678.1 hypothetical protein [Flavobacteriales bacterium]MBK8531244.1 hypothetical protein [Flavobacteriales bacterium]